MHIMCLKYTDYVKNNFYIFYVIKYKKVKCLQTKRTALIMALYVFFIIIPM